MTFFNLNINKLNIKCFIPDVLILVVAIIYWLLYSAIPYSRYLFSFILYLLLVLSIYIKLYYWRNLNMTFKSYILFMLNTVQLMLYLWGFYLFLFVIVQSPIYLQDLSVYSQYRYLLFFSCFMLFLMISSISYILNQSLVKIAKPLVFPYMKEEIRLILYSWHHIFSTYFSKFLDFVFGLTHKSRIFLLSLHFLFFNFPRIIALGLFFNFVFLKGDLRYLIYFSPFLFFIWIFSFVEYYFNVFFEESSRYIKVLVNAQLQSFQDINKTTIKASLQNITFTLTEEARQRGFDEKMLPGLIKAWDTLASLEVYFSFYKQIVIKFFRLLLLVQIFCWFNIVYIFFFKSLLHSVFATGFSIFQPFKNLVRAGTRLCVPHDPKLGLNRRDYEAAFIKHQFQKEAEKQTGGIQKGNHPGVINLKDINPDNLNEVRYHGELTHGKGTVDNPSVPLHPTQDVIGNPKPQNLIPVPYPHYLSKNFFGPIIPGSTQYLETNPARDNLNKNIAQPEDT